MTVQTRFDLKFFHIQPVFSKSRHPLKLHYTFFSLEKLEVLFLLKEVFEAFSRSQNDKTSNI